MPRIHLIAATAAAAFALGGVPAATQANAPAAAMLKPATCTITTSGGNYSGPCEFTADNTGSFVLTLANGAPIFGEVVSIGIYIQSPGVANAIVQTTGGQTQQWGTATRSKTNTACWGGDGFTVCAN